VNTKCQKGDVSPSPLLPSPYAPHPTNVTFFNRILNAKKAMLLLSLPRLR
jgi:hypothetical protein